MICVTSLKMKSVGGTTFRYFVSVEGADTYHMIQHKHDDWLCYICLSLSQLAVLLTLYNTDTPPRIFSRMTNHIFMTSTQSHFLILVPIFSNVCR